MYFLQTIIIIFYSSRVVCRNVGRGGRAGPDEDSVREERAFTAHRGRITGLEDVYGDDVALNKRLRTWRD